MREHVCGERIGLKTFAKGWVNLLDVIPNYISCCRLVNTYEQFGNSFKRDRENNKR